MAQRTEIAVVYLTGLAQGLALVAIPAASTILTNPQPYGLSNSEYGALFIPLVLCAIAASTASGRLAARWGLRTVLLGGIASNAVAMTLFASSSAFASAPTAARVALFASTAALGAGFGATLSALNAYVASFFPQRGDAALTALHALLGTGTALAPVFGALSVHLGMWWLLPVVVAAALVLLGAAGAAQPLSLAAAPNDDGRAPTPLGWHGGVLWSFIVVVMLYGVCETLLGNWATIYLHHDVGLALAWASAGLAVFWAMVTVGRVVIAAIAVRHSVRWAYVALPVAMLGALLCVSRAGGTVSGLLAFAAAGTACSAFFPLSIDFAEARFTDQAEAVSGRLVAAYMVGYGIGAFGVGPLRDAAHLSLSAIYLGAGAVAVCMAALALRVARARAPAQYSSS